MSTMTPSELMSGNGARISIDTDSLMSQHSGRAVISREQWRSAILQLLEWLREPSQLEDDGIEAPTGTIIRLALDVAEKHMRLGYVGPDSIAPDPNGGVVFSRTEHGVSELIYVWDDGKIEYMQLKGSELLQRRALQPL